MNRISTVIIGSAFVVMAVASAAPANAGGGVRLNFGGPLGNFTAGPSGGHHSSGHSHYAGKSHHSRKNAIAARKAAARRAQIAEAREREATRRQAEQRKAKERARMLAAAKRSEEKAEVVKAEVVNVETAEVEKAAPVKASAIAGADTLIPVVAVSTKANSDEVQLKTIDVETQFPKAEVAETRTAQVPAPTQKTGGVLTCKKFVPSAGLTITVPCGD